MMTQKKSWMMFSIIVFGLLGCSQQDGKIEALQQRIDQLEQKLAESYTPGFGEIMSSVQAHHAKLWFAGQNQNWKLADFEVHEIIEGIEDIELYQADRKESQRIEMINPMLEMVQDAINKKELEAFNNSYTALTSMCNECHRETEFEYNIVTIPSEQTFSNQDFRIRP